MAHYRQGDVLLISCKTIPGKTSKVPRDNQGRIVLAYGEVTGHSHAIADLEEEFAELLEAEGQRYLSVAGKKAATLTHEEHAAITISPGKYKVRIQREYSPQEIRNVRD
jgi:hypothetical protein